ncbi:MAG: hypothetical protein M3179_12870 [Actinomycetota bacterium]|nr:hypothetical protein [Actinomycetota bacterium]
MAAGGALVALLPFAVDPAAAAVFSNTTPILGQFEGPGNNVVAAEPYPSNIEVSGLSGTVTDVNVHLFQFSATFPSDVDLMIVAPGGRAAHIWSDVGGNGGIEGDDHPECHDVAVANLDFVLDDSAPTTLPGCSPLVGGTFRPFDDDNELPFLNDTDLFPAPAPASTPNVALSTFNGINPNGTWKLYMTDDWPGDAGDLEFVFPEFRGGWSLDITTTEGGGSTSTTSSTTTTAPPGNESPPPADFDGDGDTDIAVFRPSNGIWFVNGGSTVAWGTNSDIPVSGDYDGDGDTDIAVFRPTNGLWFVNGGSTVAFGASGDIPVPGDYDGDGDTDVAVFRPASGVWFIQGGPAVGFGANGDIPVPGDYDGDGDTDIAVFRPSNGLWFVQGGPTVAFGTNGDIPAPGDYDGDGDTDVAVFRPSSGVWFVNGGATVGFGTSGDVPVPLPDAIRRFFFPPL